MFLDSSNKLEEELIMSFKTKAALLKAPYDIELIDRELICGDDDVIVKNHLIGIC